MLQIAAVCLGVAFFLALAGLAYYSSTAPVYPNEQQAAAQSAEKKPAEKQHPFRGFANFLFPDSISIFTFWLVIATVVLGVVTYVQIVFLGRAEIISARSAQAAKESADVAKDSLLVGQRAYVFVTFVQSIVMNSDTKQILGWTFTPIWNNSGPTPTRNMRNHVSLKVFDGSIPETWDFPDIWDKKIKPENRKEVLIPLGPRSATSGQAVFVDINQVREIVAGSKTLYLWGWARYNDVFPDTAEHITRFANRVHIDGDPTDAQKTSISYPLHDKYNCSDDECSRQNYPGNWEARVTDE